MTYDNIIIMGTIMMMSGFLSTMNLWVVNKKHARWHLNDLYMVLLMTAWSFALSYIFQRHMMSSQVIFIVSVLSIVMIIYLIRTQTFINDKQFLNGMIPHHSMAVLMAEKIKEKTNNPRIRSLANNIVTSQTKEIQLMEEILNEEKR